MVAIALTSLPLGFRFHPTDEELVNHYLKPKITGQSSSEVQVIAEIDVCKCEPWDLPDKSLIRSDDPEWFFFAPKDRKYPNGQRSNRATEKGYWKATGKDRTIKSKPSAGKNAIIGMKKTLVFHRGRAPKGVRTNWIMHEYRTTEPEFESGDQGGYLLYRLFRKAEEISASSKADEIEMNVLSPTPTKSSPSGTQNEADVMDEIEPVLNIDSPTSDMQEEPKSSSDYVQKELSDIQSLLPGEGYIANQSVKQERKSCNPVSPDEEAKMGEKDESLQDVLAKFFEPEYGQTNCDVFPNVSSPMLPYVAYPFAGNANQEEQIGSYLVDNVGDDALNAYLISALNPDDCSSSASVFPKETFVETFPNHGSWDSASFKDSGSGSDTDAEPGLPQSTAGLEASQCFYGSSLLPGGSLRMKNNSVVYPEMKTQLSTLYENASLLPYDITGPDVYSVDYGAESLQDLFNSMDELVNQKTVCDNTDDFVGTGIKLRSRDRQQDQTNSSDFSSQQGGAARRLRLQSSIGKAPFSVDLHDSISRLNSADKGLREKVKLEFADDGVDESTSAKNPINNSDGLLDTGIKIRARRLQNLPDEPLTQHAAASFTHSYELQCELVSDDESSTRENNADKESVVKVKHESCDSLEESIGDKNALSNTDDLLDTGIKIRARQPLKPPNESFTQHARISFTQQYDLHCESFSDDESSIRDVADKQSVERVKPELRDSLEESRYEKNAMSIGDDHYDTGIKIKARQLQDSPNEPFTQHVTNSTNFCRQHGSVSDNESTTRDSHDNKTGKTKAGEHVNDNESEATASALPAVPDNLEGLPVHDDMPTCTTKYELSKPKPILRTKLTEEGDDVIKSSPSQLKAPRSHSVAACTIYLLSSSVLVLSCYGAWRCMQL